MIPLWLLALGSCSDLMSEVADTSATTSDSTAGSGPGTTAATNPTATMPDSVTEGMTTATTSATATTTTDPDTTVGPVDTTDGTTAAPECMDDDGCGTYELCSKEGQCEPICPEWGPGSYQGCLHELGGYDLLNLCGGGPPGFQCAVWGNPTEATACTTQNCTTACDCPEPPPTGNATVTCGNLIDDGVNDCYLSCADGETCPEGMSCRNKSVCVTEPLALPMYGNCAALAADCGVGSTCYIIAGSYSMCATTCTDATRCDMAPMGSANAADCDFYIDPPPETECGIPCSTTMDCPYIMQCVNNSFCAWPLP